jgi:exodeoxyribonuclease X
MKLIVIDTETSDLDPNKGAAILELAWMVIEHDSERWRPVSAYETYIQYSGPINPHAQASHHIKADCLTPHRAMLRADAVQKLLNELEPDTFTVAHNSEFDAKFLPEVTNQWICTFKAAKKVWPGAPGYSNQVLRYWLNVNPDLSLAPSVKARAPHQALYDVATTTGILLKMLEQHSPAELYQLCTSPSRLRTIDFGKHKGTPFEQVPKDYLKWLRDQPQLDADLKFTLDSILQP